MDTKALYNQWSSTYDDVENKTRDLEKIAGQKVLASLSFKSILELGCGTGKNTAWLQTKAGKLLAVDFSEDMMAKAKEKVNAPHVTFVQADITKPWTFVTHQPDLITCSLILEHVKDLAFVFEQAAAVLSSQGQFYICELHPYKQYSGSKARFETKDGLQTLDCFIHHVSDYIEAAFKNNFELIQLKEWFDDKDATISPRLISFLFRTKATGAAEKKSD